ncbi:MAG: hypothetical protein CL842_03325 [Crocinitomicaceae bacterium]|nr:hypothetical protein [Crocinitomicaceae bacterium]
MKALEANRTFINILNDSRIQFLFFSICIYLIAVVEYQNFVVEQYRYMGFPGDFSLLKAGLAFVVYLLSHLLLYLKVSRFIRGFTALFILIFFMPILVLYQFASDVGGWFVFSSLMLLLIINANWSFAIPRTIVLKENDRPFVYLALSVFIFIPFLLSYKVHLDPELFLLGEKIYAIRAGLSDKGNLFTGYMLSPLFQFILPILAIYGLSSKKFYLTVIAFCLTILMYLMIPQKSIFLGIFVILFFYFFKDPLRKVSVLAGIILLLLIFGAYLTHTSDAILLESLVLRRYFFVPAFLNHVYFDFFEGENLYYSYSFLKGVFDYPYDLNPSFLIGREFFGGRILNANNGFMSDGYINFGVLGMLISTSIVAFVIKFFDKISIDAKFFGLFFLLINLLRSSALPTIVLTHGLWLLVLFGFFTLRNYRPKRFES